MMTKHELPLFLLMAILVKVDAIVTSVKNQGIFAEVGPLTVFVSKHVCSVSVLVGENSDF